MTEWLLKTSFEEIIQSDLFTFYIGEEKKPFRAHSKAVAATSQVFDRLVNGGMSETQTRSAELRDVDPDTFVRFLEYAYRHDYTDPALAQETPLQGDSTNGETPLPNPFQASDPVIPDDDSIEPASFGAVSDWGWTNSRSAPSEFGAIPSSFSASNSIKKLKKSKTYQAGSRAAFERREYASPSYHVLTPLRAQSGLDSDTSPGVSSQFLAHARLYTLADMRMVFPLKELTLHRLHKALVAFELRPECLGDVVDLARYAYEQGEDRSTDGKIDALRDMVVNYIACEMKVLGKHADFRNLMDGGGEFAGDFWDIVSQELL